MVTERNVIDAIALYYVKTNNDTGRWLEAAPFIWQQVTKREPPHEGSRTILTSPIRIDASELCFGTGCKRTLVEVSRVVA